MLHDEIAACFWSRPRDELPHFQLVLYDDARDVVIGEARTVPFRWDGLPGGLDDVLIQGFSGDAAPTALSACVAIVAPHRRGEGLSRLLIEGMREVAGVHGLQRFVAPVRPTMKAMYPLTSMARYVQWRRFDGLPLDPWLRVHVRLGAEMLGVCDRSMVVNGTIDECQS